MFDSVLRRSPCRVLLACALAIVLPIKALAAVVIPITGMPDHRHQTHTHTHMPAHPGTTAGELQHAHHDAGSETPHCHAHAPASAGAGDTVHEHSCPHLGMASVATAPPVFDLAAPPLHAPPFVDTPHRSVVLDVPSPPPTRFL